MVKGLGFRAMGFRGFCDRSSFFARTLGGRQRVRPSRVCGVWGTVPLKQIKQGVYMESHYNIPKAIFYLLKGQGRGVGFGAWVPGVGLVKHRHEEKTKKKASPP